MSTQGWRAVCNESCKHGSGRGTRHALWANGPYSTLSMADSAVRGADARRDGALDGNPRLPFEEGDASGLGVFSGAPGVHHGRLQCAGPVAWFPAPRVGFRAPLDGGV